MSERKMCQRMCIDDICRGGETLCGAEFCASCGNLSIDGDQVCDDCYEQQMVERDKQMDEFCGRAEVREEA